MPAGDVVNREFALLFCERGVLAVPTDDNTLPAQDGALLGSEKPFVLLKRSVDAVPGVSPLAVTVGDTIEAIENAAVMRRMDLGILIQASGDDSISTGRKDVVENFIRPNSTCWRGFVEAFVMIRHDLPLAENEIRVMAGLI